VSCRPRRQERSLQSTKIRALLYFLPLPQDMDRCAGFPPLTTCCGLLSVSPPTNCSASISRSFLRCTLRVKSSMVDFAASDAAPLDPVGGWPGTIPPPPSLNANATAHRGFLQELRYGARGLQSQPGSRSPPCWPRRSYCDRRFERRRPDPLPLPSVSRTTAAIVSVGIMTPLDSNEFCWRTATFELRHHPGPFGSRSPPFRGLDSVRLDGAEPDSA